MFAYLKASPNKSGLIGFISGMNDSFTLYAFDPVTEKIVKTFGVDAKDAERFMADLSPSNKNVFKAFIVDLFSLKPKTTSFVVGYKFCIALRKKFQELKIPYYFISSKVNLLTCLLVSAKVEVKYGESVMVILHHDGKVKSLDTFTMSVAELKYTPKGYEFKGIKDLTALNSKDKPDVLYQQICGTANPKKVVVSTTGNVAFNTIFDPKILTVFDVNDLDFRDEMISETYKWMVDKKQVRYHFVPSSAKSFHVYGEYGSDKNIVDIFKVDKNEPLPIKKTAIISKSVPELIIEVRDDLTSYCYQETLSKNCHGFEITLTVDEENFEEYQIRSLGYRNIVELPKDIGGVLKSKIPFIAFYDNSSLIGVYEGSEGYKFLDGWNGMHGNDCFISFDEEKPKFGQPAMDVLKTKNTFVVFDLIKIMSMPPDNIKVDKTWGFTITKDDKNPVLLQFDSFDGTKKCSSPPFLMALYLRQHLKAIESKTGEKPKEIAFCLVKQEFSQNEMGEIGNNLRTSCNLLKLDCCFICIRNSEA